MSEAVGSPTEVDRLLARDRSSSLRRLPSMLRLAFGIVRAAAPRELRWLIVLQAAAAAGIAAQLLAARSVIERLVSPDVTVASALPSIAAFVAATALTILASRSRIELQRMATELVSRHAIDRVLLVASRAHTLLFEEPSFHDRLQRAMVNSGGRPAQMATGLLTIAGAGFVIFGAIIALVVVEPLFLAVVLVGLIPVWMLNAVASRANYGFSVRQVQRDRRRTYLAGLLTRRETAAELRAYGTAEPLRERHDRLWSERIHDLRSLVRRRIVLGAAAGLATALMVGAVLIGIAWLVSDGRMSVAEAGTAAGGVVVLASRLLAVSAGTASLFESALFLDDYATFVDDLAPLTQETPDGGTPLRFDTITVDSVSFTYPSSAEPVLHDVSLDIGADEVVALVGENGSGKTTLTKVLAGLFEPDSGTVLWDGVPAAELALADRRRSVAVVLQDFVRYLLTARDNIALGDPHRSATDDAVDGAAEAAGAGFLRDLPAGYDTQLGPEFWVGTELSVGQWQRVALARAFFRDSPLLILDEPTASLDARSEAELFESIRELARGRAVLLISHRFSTVRSADRIYVVRSGRIAEVGTHDELVAAGGHYAELYRLQAAAYRDEADTVTLRAD